MAKTVASAVLVKEGIITKEAGVALTYATSLNRMLQFIDTGKSNAGREKSCYLDKWVADRKNLAGETFRRDGLKFVVTTAANALLRGEAGKRDGSVLTYFAGKHGRQDAAHLDAGAEITKGCFSLLVMLDERWEG